MEQTEFHFSVVRCYQIIFKMMFWGSWDMVRVIECFSSKDKALSSIASAAKQILKNEEVKKKGRERERKKGGERVCV
jgi:hypothetical protein